MSKQQELLRKILVQALSGRGSHVLVDSALEGLDFELAGSKPEGAPHSVFQIVNHMIYWNDFCLRWLEGDKPPTPRHAATSWPGAESPRSDREWNETLSRFGESVAELSRRAEADEPFADKGSKKSALEILQMIASHNSYHVGQIAVLRRVLKSWPPPGGGATW